MSIVAIVPVAQMTAANLALEEAGFGPRNFTVPAYGATGATHAALHAWEDASFRDALALVPGVVVNGVEDEGDPITFTAALIEAQVAQWGAQAPVLPDGPVTADTLYRYEDGLWWVIQPHDRSVYGGDPAQYPALVRRAREPGKALPWVQPLDQFDAYKLLDPFTGKPQRCLHGGKEFETLVDNNVWTPAHGLQWRDVAYVAPPTGAWSGASVAYKVGDKVTYSGKTYTCRQAHTSQAGWTPTAVPALWEVVP